MTESSDQELLRLMDVKKQMENQISEYHEILKANNNVGMKESLVDQEGYPRNDIDVQQVRETRVKLIRLQNDYKHVFKECENLLIKLHSSHKPGPEDKIGRPPTFSQSVTRKLAIVGNVAKGSPSDLSIMAIAEPESSLDNIVNSENDTSSTVKEEEHRLPSQSNGTDSLPERKLSGQSKKDSDRLPSQSKDSLCLEKNDTNSLATGSRISESEQIDNGLPVKRKRGRPRKLRNKMESTGGNQETVKKVVLAYSKSIEPSSTTLLDEGVCLAEANHSHQVSNENEKEGTKMVLNDTLPTENVLQDVGNKIEEYSLPGHKKRKDRWKKKISLPKRILPAREARNRKQTSQGINIPSTSASKPLKHSVPSSISNNSESAVLGKEVPSKVYNPNSDSAKIGPESCSPKSKTLGKKRPCPVPSKSSKHNKHKNVVRNQNISSESEDIIESKYRQNKSDVNNDGSSSSALFHETRSDTFGEPVPGPSNRRTSNVKVPVSSITRQNYVAKPSVKVNARGSTVRPEKPLSLNLSSEMIETLMQNYIELKERRTNPSRYSENDEYDDLDRVNQPPRWLGSFIEEMQSLHMWKLQHFARMQEEMVEEHRKVLEKIAATRLNNLDFLEDD